MPCLSVRIIGIRCENLVVGSGFAIPVSGIDGLDCAVEGSFSAGIGALGVGKTTVYKLLKTGDLSSVRIGRSRRIPAAHVAGYVRRLIDGGLPNLIQVKARSGGWGEGWIMSAKHEEICDADLLYCFVNFAIVPPSVHVIPAKIVAAKIKIDHATWLATPGKHDRPHKDSSRRLLRPAMHGAPLNWIDEYLEAWHLVGANLST